MTFLGWLLSHKLLVFLIVATGAFCISTIVLGVENKDMRDKVDEYEKNNSNSTVTTTTTTTTTAIPVVNTTLSPVTTLSPTTLPPEEDNMSKYRLPSTIKPILYDLTLLPDLKTGNFSGKVLISVEVSEAGDKIILHSNKLEISSVKFDNEDANFELDNDYELAVITRKDGGFFEVKNTNLEVEFNGDMKNRIVGLYTSTYKDSAQSSTTIATSKFEPTYARQAFPCFDEPNMKAPYIVHLLKPKEEKYIALSNYPVKSIQTYDENNDLVTFEKTVNMSTYLTCFIVSDFISTNTTFENAGTTIPLRVFASPDNLAKTQYAGEVGKSVIEYYVKYFGIPYPLPKLDMVAIPDFVSGAMEHWGLVTYRETALLYTPETHSSSNKQRVATVVAHELAHSWFGNLVTMDWWNDLWLNEGFASYIEYKGVHAHHPDWEMMTQFLTGDLHAVLSYDATLSSHPIVQNVTTPDQITSIFDTISYNKGASILRMLETTVGVDNFQKGVTNYLNKYAYGNAVTKNFLDEIQAVVGDKVDVHEMMDTYTIQTGYPIVHVSGSETDTKWTLTQERFLKNPDATYDPNETKYGYKWTIPITYITDTGVEVSTMFKYNESSITIEVPSGAKWIKLNRDQTGYYRVNYTSWMYDNLAENYHSLSVADRSHLLEEEFSLAEAGILTYDMPLELTKKLQNETSYTPWNVGGSKLLNLIVRLKEVSVTTNSISSYLKKLVTTAYDDFTWNETDDDSHLRRLTRVVVLNLACEAGHEECLEEAQSQFNNWIATNQSLSQDLRSLVYKYGMKKADEATWNTLLERYINEIDANEKLKLVNGLANVENPALLARLIELAKNESIVRGQDYFTVMQYISANDNGTDLVWNWVRENWEYLADRFTLNDRYLGSLIPYITGTFSTNEKLNEMNEFFTKYPNAGAGETNRKRALETVSNNIRWTTRYRTQIQEWVDRQFES